jgi:hypothetical protein
MAMATKLTGSLLLAPIMVAHGFGRWQVARSQSAQPKVQNSVASLVGLLSLVRLAATFSLILLVWLALNPSVVLNPRIYFDLDNNASALAQWLVVRGDLSVLYTLQFENTTPYLYIVTNWLLWGMGLPLEVLALAGAAYSGWRLLHPVRSLLTPASRGAELGATSSFADAYLLSWLLAYFFVSGGWHAKFIRYALPLIPVLCILASRLLVDLWNRGKSVGHGFSTAVAVCTVSASLAYTAGYLQIYRQPDVRLTAANWVQRHIPPGASILVENDSGLFFHEAEKKYGLKGYTWKIWDPYEIHGVRGVRYQAPAVSEHQTRAYLGSLLITDYVIISTSWYERFTAAANRFPAQAEFYRRLFNGQAGYRLVQKFQRYPQLGPFSWRTDSSEITFRLFDNPTIYVFEKRMNSRPTTGESGVGIDEDAPGSGWVRTKIHS